MNEATANSSPLGAQETTPGVPFTSTRRELSANRRNVFAPAATASAPCTTRRKPGRRTPPSAALHDIGVEQREQCLEVTVASRGEEGIHDRALTIEVGVGHRCSPHATSGTARQLARGGRRAPDDGGDLVERHREHVVEHEGDALGRGQRVEHDEQREADRVPEQRLLLGVHPVLSAQDRVGMCGSRGASRRVLRDRRMFRQTRATTVVSQARRFSISFASVRLSRIQVSWIASSASLSEPSMR